MVSSFLNHYICSFFNMLDPKDWSELRKQGHHMLDDMFDYLQNIQSKPVWQQAPSHVQASFQDDLSEHGQPLSQLHEQFMHDILPYSVGNTHPGFMGWVHGGGTPVGMLAEMLAAGLNANLGGRNQIPIDVEWQVIGWMRDLFGFPDGSSGILTTGTSSATIIALTTARHAIATTSKPLAVYASIEAHGCITRALKIMGMDINMLRKIPTNDEYQMDIISLQQHIQNDQQHSIQPWLIIGTAGSVNTGSIDDLSALAEIAKKVGAWLHIDGALGALAMLSASIAPRLQGIQHADSLAMDFHKWGQVPYDAGLALIRDGENHRQCFSTGDTYLQRESKGLAAHSPWPCDYGMDLSRGFRALKIWFTFQHFGKKRLGDMIEHSCELAQYLTTHIQKTDNLELMAPVSLNIVCFRYIGDGSQQAQAYDAINRAMICHIHTSGLAAPSLTYLNHRAVIRAAIVNHRTQIKDIGKLLAAVQQAARVCDQIPH
ncbi:MAG: aminotransferase class V-fold PLP-dependent enzyme [Mariprofundaceae bacterium]|nr:aminotransferase class V-fold PLP-dependent enzyme [Mariprofundaceae bacterium]